MTGYTAFWSSVGGSGWTSEDPCVQIQSGLWRHWRACTKCTIERFETQHAFAQHNLKIFNLFYRLPRLAHSQQTTDWPWNVGCGQYLTSILFFLLDPAAKIAWWWVSNPWWMISNWKSRGPCSQSPGNFSLTSNSRLCYCHWNRRESWMCLCRLWKDGLDSRERVEDAQALCGSKEPEWKSEVYQYLSSMLSSKYTLVLHAESWFGVPDWYTQRNWFWISQWFLRELRLSTQVFTIRRNLKQKLVIINARFDALKQDLLPFLRGHTAA